MSAVQLRTVILSLLLFPVAALPLTAKPVELKDLNQEMLRGRVKEYLAHPASAQRLAALSNVVLRDEQIFFIAQPGQPTRLEWRYLVLPNFDPNAEAQTQAALRDLLHEVLVNFNGGLLTESDAQKVLAHTVFVPVPAYAYIPWRFVVYPWVATAPRSYYWWQYPWYAAPWWADPWRSYWQVAGYYPTPWGYWWLPPEYFWPRPGFYPAPAARVGILVWAEGTAEPIAASRTAESLYLEGYGRYWDGDIAEARRLLRAAVERDPMDARSWYFKALAEQQLGDEAAAHESARHGAALELLSASRGEISHSLERVQGDARWFLRAAGADLTAARAREIVAGSTKVAAAK
jgi:hypothetical protein